MKPKKKGKRIPKRIYEPLTEEQFKSLLSNSNKDIHKLAFLLAYGSGLRISEIVNLKPDNIDMDRHRIMIRQAKGQKDRVVNTPNLLKRNHLKLLPINITERALNQAFVRASKSFNSLLYMDKAGRKRYKYHFHCLRGSFATRALEMGIPINQVQALLGHENLATTSRYTKANPFDAIQNVIDRGV